MSDYRKTLHHRFPRLSSRFSALPDLRKRKTYSLPEILTGGLSMFLSVLRAKRMEVYLCLTGEFVEIGAGRINPDPTSQPESGSLSGKRRLANIPRIPLLDRYRVS
jgi:hypothetical protein